MAGNVIDEFFVALGFEVKKEGAAEFEKQLKEVAKTAAKVTAAIVAAVGAVAWFTANTAYAVDALGDFAEREDVAIDSLSAFGHAAQIAGSSLEAVMQSVEGVNRTIGEAALGIGRGKTAFKDLALEARDSSGKIKTSFELITEVADRFKTLSQQESIAMAEKLGIDRSLIPLLKKGAAGIAELTDEARAFGVVTSEQAALAGDLTDSLDRSKFVFSAVQRQLASALMPTLLRISNEVRAWVLANKDLVRSGIERFVRVATLTASILLKAMLYLGRAVSWVVVQLDDLAQWLTTTKTGMLVLAAAMSTLTGLAIIKGWQLLAGAIMMASRALWTFLANPVVLFATLLGAAVLAVGLLVQDIMTWVEGGDSLVGRLLGPWEEFASYLGNLWSPIAAKWSQFVDVLSAGAALVKALFGLMFGPLIYALQQLWSAAKDVFGWIYDALVAAGSLYLDAWVFVIGSMLEALTSFVAPVLGIWGSIWSAVKDGASSAIDWIIGLLDPVLSKFETLSALWGAAKNFGSKVAKLVGATASSEVAKLVGATASSKVARLVGATPSSEVAQALAQAPKAGTVTGRGAAEAAVAVGAQTSISNSKSTNVSNVTNIGAPIINVKSTDPIAAGKEVSREMQVLMRAASRNTQSGVAG